MVRFYTAVLQGKLYVTISTGNVIYLYSDFHVSGALVMWSYMSANQHVGTLIPLFF